MKLLKNKLFIEIIFSIVGILISLGMTVLIILSLIKYIWG